MTQATILTGNKWHDRLSIIQNNLHHGFKSVCRELIKHNRKNKFLAGEKL